MNKTTVPTLYLTCKRVVIKRDAASVSLEVNFGDSAFVVLVLSPDEGMPELEIIETETETETDQ
jgi:hypothetical protein